MIKEIILNNISELDNELSKLDSGYIFRGQSNSDWKLSTTMDRFINAKDKFIVEQHLLEDFKIQSEYFLDDEKQPKTALDALSLMQHYGGATRLLDFTASPYIALFFAYSNELQEDGNISIFAIKYMELAQKSLLTIKSDLNMYKESISEDVRAEIDIMYDPSVPEQFNELFLSPLQRNIVTPIKPTSMNKRLLPQNGIFLGQGNINISFEDNLKDMYNTKLENESSILKFVLSNKFRLEILDKLDRMGIRESSMFPDLSGFVKGQSTKLEIDYFRAGETIFDEKYLHSEVIKGYSPENSVWNFKLNDMTGTNPYK